MLSGTERVHNQKSFFLPFHAAEQHSKERISDSAEYPVRGTTFRCRPFFASSTLKGINAGNPPLADSSETASERLPFRRFAAGSLGCLNLQKISLKNRLFFHTADW